MPSLGTMDTLSVSDLSMYVDTSATGVRVKDTPETPTRRATNAAGEKRRQTINVGVRVVVELHHASLRVRLTIPAVQS